MIEWILNGAQVGYNMGLITADFFFSIVFGIWGYQLYSAGEKSSDAGDKSFKVPGVIMMVIGVIDILVSVGKLI